jgi:hypothetical protein
MRPAGCRRLVPPGTTGPSGKRASARRLRRRRHRGHLAAARRRRRLPGRRPRPRPRRPGREPPPVRRRHSPHRARRRRRGGQRRRGRGPGTGSDRRRARRGLRRHHRHPSPTSRRWSACGRPGRSWSASSCTQADQPARRRRPPHRPWSDRHRAAGWCGERHGAAATAWSDGLLGKRFRDPGAASTTPGRTPSPSACSTWSSEGYDQPAHPAGASPARPARSRSTAGGLMNPPGRTAG